MPGWRCGCSRSFFNFAALGASAGILYRASRDTHVPNSREPFASPRVAPAFAQPGYGAPYQSRVLGVDREEITGHPNQSADCDGNYCGAMLRVRGLHGAAVWARAICAESKAFFRVRGNVLMKPVWLAAFALPVLCTSLLCSQTTPPCKALRRIRPPRLTIRRPRTPKARRANPPATADSAPAGNPQTAAVNHRQRRTTPSTDSRCRQFHRRERRDRASGDSGKGTRGDGSGTAREADGASAVFARAVAG